MDNDISSRVSDADFAYYNGTAKAHTTESSTLISSSPYLNHPELRALVAQEMLRRNGPDLPNTAFIPNVVKILMELEDWPRIFQLFEEEKARLPEFRAWLDGRKISLFKPEELAGAAPGTGEPERVAYAMTKAAVNALVRHIASRWGKEGVRANAIAPGMVLTDQLRDQLPQDFIDRTLAVHRSDRLGRSEDIAAMVAMLFSADGEWITGQVLAVDGGASIRP